MKLSIKCHQQKPTEQQHKKTRARRNKSATRIYYRCIAPYNAHATFDLEPVRPNVVVFHWALPRACIPTISTELQTNTSVDTFAKRYSCVFAPAILAKFVECWRSAACPCCARTATAFCPRHVSHWPRNLYFPMSAPLSSGFSHLLSCDAMPGSHSRKNLMPPNYAKSNVKFPRACARVFRLSKYSFRIEFGRRPPPPP